MIEGLSALDRGLFLALNSYHATWLNPLMQVLSGQTLWAPFIGYFFWYSYRRIGKTETVIFGLFLTLTIIASDVTSSYIMKNIFQRLRPCRELDLKPLIYSFGQKCGGKYGFVSSHAANSVALVLFSIRCLGLNGRCMGFFLVLPVLVALSRIYLGVHYPGDILGGAVVGAGWAWVLSSLYRSRQGATLKRSQARPFRS